MSDRRLRKTDEAIRAAFLRLLFAVRYDSISMSRVAAEADVSRSTLYKHFPTRDVLLETSMEHLLAVLADAAAGRADTARLDQVLRHFWDNRRLARAVFGPPVDAIIRRSLAARIGEANKSNGGCEVAAQAIKLAAGSIAVLESWLTGRLDVSRETIAATLTAGNCRCEAQP